MNIYNGYNIITYYIRFNKYIVGINKTIIPTLLYHHVILYHIQKPFNLFYYYYFNIIKTSEPLIKY